MNTPSSKPTLFQKPERTCGRSHGGLSVSPDNLNKLADVGSPVATTLRPLGLGAGPPKHFAGTTRAMHDGLCVVICSRGILVPVTEGKGGGLKRGKEIFWR